MNAPLRWPQMPERVKSNEIHYPETDGKPMAESDLHRDMMLYLVRVLQRFFAGQPVYVSGNLLVYYEQGNRCATQEAQRAAEAEAENARLRAELAKLRGDQ